VVVVGEVAEVDVGLELVPFLLGPPGGALAAGADVGDEEEAGDGWVGGGGVDEVDGGVAVDLVSLCSLDMFVCGEEAVEYISGRTISGPPLPPAPVK
jgi:hypothetical protein